MGGADGAATPTVGRIVHVGIGRDAGGLVVVAPAIVVHVATRTPEDFLPRVEVQVFLRRFGMHRAPRPFEVERRPVEAAFTPTLEEDHAGIAWREAVPYGHRVGEWHWPERA